MKQSKLMSQLIELDFTEYLKINGGCGGSNFRVGCLIAKFHNWVDEATARHVERIASTDPSLLID